MADYGLPAALPRDLLEDPDMVAALEAHDFGAVFRLARSRAGISYSKIAAECDIKPDRVGTLARGQGRVTSFDKIVRIADALRIPGHMVSLAPRPWEKGGPPAPSTHAQNGNDVRRRTFVAGSATGLAAALPTLSKVAAPRHISESYVDSLRERTARLRRLDNLLGGGDTYRVYLGEYQATKSLLRTVAYRETTHHTLLSLLAEQAQQAGWAAFDSGREADAASLYKESYAAAREAGDSDLIGNSLAFLAYQTLSSDRRAAVEIACRSCETIGAGTPSGVQALLHERKAWACAVAGLPDETARALDDAAAALDNRGDDDDLPDWAAWVDRTELDIMSGRCWAELRRPLRAVPLLKRALDQFDDSHARDKSLYLSWLADAYLTAGEVDQAAAVTGRALDLAHGVASIRPRRRLAPVLNRLAQHRGKREVADLLEKAQA